MCLNTSFLRLFCALLAVAVTTNKLCPGNTNSELVLPFSAPKQVSLTLHNAGEPVEPVQ